MKLSVRIFGVLAIGCAAVSLAWLSPIPGRWLRGAATLAYAEEDPVLFYRDPMGGAEISKQPRKDDMGMDFVPVRRSQMVPLLSRIPRSSQPSSEDPLFFRDAMGGTEISFTPKTDDMGMDFLPVRSSDLKGLLPAFDHGKAQAPSSPSAATTQRKLLYYRNPMGLPDTSLVPKKDPMGMDYRPVYEGDEEDDSTIKVTPGKIQRTGVRSALVERTPIVSQIRVPGSIQLDERRVTVVATRAVAFIEQVPDVTTGDQVKKGDVLLRLYSQEIAAAAAQYLSVITSPAVVGPAGVDGARRRLENLAVPPEFLSEIERTRKVPLSVAWLARRDATVLSRNVVEGQKAEPGETLFRLADLSTVWALIDVAEHDQAQIALGQDVKMRVRGLPDRIFSGRVNLIYPTLNKDTRTVRVRIELPNPDRVLRPDMYVDAEIASTAGPPVVSVPESAVIDTGKRQIVILDWGNGRFEPKDVKTGRRGEGMVEIQQGLVGGERVVVSANFLIDAESNLKSAMSGLHSEHKK